MNKVELHVGEGREAMGRRFVGAWNRAHAGEELNERHLSFDSFETLASVLTPKRLETLRALRAEGSASVAELARRLGRDYKRVHADVEALVEAGFIERDGGLRAPFGAFVTTIEVDARPQREAVGH